MIDGRFRFDNFVVGTANRLAVSAARAVGDAPGAVYTPLFVYAGSGMGKTHLLGALGFSIRARHPALRVEALSLEDFVDQLHSAIAGGQAESFKRRYQATDVLLLDDVQFLSGRVETQSELLRIFNALQESGRQIVMTSDRPPSEISDVDQRLISRLAGGLIVDIGTPDFETRVAILRHKCVERNITFAPGVLEELARSPRGNVRELQGALNRYVAQQAVETTARNGEARPGNVASSVVVPPDHADYDSFLSDIAVAVAQSVEAWRVRLGEFIARWSGDGFRTESLERVLDRADAPDIGAIEARFSAACERLRSIEAEAVRLDPKFAGMAVFRDPDCIEEAEDLLARAFAVCDPPPAPRPNLTLSTFIATPANQVAVRAVSDVIESPGKHYNPLLVCGPSASGKTHLLHAIGNALAARVDGAWTVACTDAAQFTDELIAAIQSDTVERWRARYRACDAFVLDNVHHLGGKERTQEELFHLFNSLHERGRQIVLASAVPPRQMTDIAPRLRSRFDGGLVVEMARVAPAERAGRTTPVHPGDEAAAPTIDPVPTHAPLSAPLRTLPEALLADITRDGLESAVGIDVFFLDPEKMIADWPGVDGRVIEEAR